ncbi:MAG: RNA polymerase sigma factor [Actinomycetota bacterium]|nr:RNA polymerase sigma factor [Actinomycetota bacterium]
MVEDRRSDEALPAAAKRDPAAFGAFYERHEDAVLLFFLRRTGRPELAADLAAETFAAALVSSGRFRPGPSPAAAWLFGIARNTLAMSARRGRVERRARRKLGLPPLVLDDEALERVAEVERDGRVLERLAALPADQRRAVEARVLNEREYAEIARELRCSEAVVRQRVSRGLRTIRAELGGERP